MNPAIQNLHKLRALSKKMRPEQCCQGGLMKEHGKPPTRVCSNDCQWQELDRLIAIAMVDAELG